MTYSPTLTNSTGPAPTRVGKAAPHATVSLRALLMPIAGTLRTMLRAAQYGQMQRVLKQMPDSTLTEIGISRSGIPDYARSLFEDD